MEKKVTNLGTGGLNVDTPSHQLPPNVFSDGMNLRFTPENKIRGSYQFVDETTPRLSASETIGVSYAADATRSLLTYDPMAVSNQVLVGSTQVDSAVSFREHNSGDLSLGYSDDFKPTFIEFNDVVVLNTGFTPPLYVDSMNNLQVFDNWYEDVNGVSGPPSTDAANNFIARRMKPWGSQLVFFNLFNDKPGTDNDTSDPIDLIISGIEGVNVSGTLTRQRFTVASNFVGSDDFILSGTAGRIVDGLELRESFMAYKSDSWVRIDRQVTQTGVFYSSQVLTSDDGILTSDCVIEFDNALHFVVGNHGIYIHNGSEERQNISKGVMEDSFYNELKNPDRTFVHKWTDEKEIWVCYSNSDTESGVQAAWCFNYELKVWYKRTLPNLRDIVETTVDSLTTHFAVDGESITSMSTTVFETEAFLVKRNADLGDASVTKRVINLYPQGDGTVSLGVQGHQSISNDTVTSVTLVDDYRLNVRTTGRYLDLRIEGDDPQLSAIGFEVLPGSKR